MKKKTLLWVCFNVILLNGAFAQQGFPVTDQQPVEMEGLSCGYHIKSLETKKVGDKGDFSRYSINFYVKNVSGWPKVLPFRQGINGMNGVADNLVQFNCLNATGARLTNKYAVIKAPPYNAYHDRRYAQTGYGLMPGQTINVEEVMIVPLNEPLNIMVFYIGYSQQLVPLNATDVNPRPAEVAEPLPDQPPPVFNSQNFYQVRNAANNTFINVQTGVISSSPIQNGWWSAQWQIIPVPGSIYFKLKNRWKSSFIDTDRGYITMAPDDRSQGTLWSLEPLQGNMFYIKNVQSGQYLCVISNQIRLMPDFYNKGSSWMIQ
jgi:hypothetical protein